MASPQSGGEGSAKVPKDRSCPFCGQAFTSSSLGRHLDLYIKPKNPKPPDGIHNVDEIRKIRGNITRRQSRVPSLKRDISAPAGSASKKFNLTGSVSTSPIGHNERFDKSRGVSFNKPGWEATGVINDLPPRMEAQSGDRRGSTKRHQQKGEYDQRQRVAEELDTGRAAQLALKELLTAVRGADTSATGRNLFDFDFFTSSFPTLCIRILTPPPPVNATMPTSGTESWSLHMPWQPQYESMLREVDDRAQLLRLRTGSLSPSREDQMPDTLNVGKFHGHITRAWEQWKSLSDTYRRDIWQREILRGFVRVEADLKDAKNTILSLRREVRHLAERLDKAHGTWASHTSSQQERYLSPWAPLTSLRVSDDLMKELCKQGLNLREWDYERLLRKWKAVVRDERRISNGLSAQRNLSSNHDQRTSNANNLSVSAHESTPSRSGSVASGMSAAPVTRTSSMGSDSHETDAEGEDDDAEGSVEDDDESAGAAMYQQANHLTKSPQTTESLPQRPSRPQITTADPRLANIIRSTPTQSPISPHGWTQNKRMDSWPVDFAQHSMVMDGLEGPSSSVG